MFARRSDSVVKERRQGFKKEVYIFVGAPSVRVRDMQLNQLV